MNTTELDYFNPAMRIGIDIGRVIISAADESGHSDTSFLSGNDESALRTNPAPAAFEVIRELNEAADGAVWLVSKCGPRIQSLTRRWLAAWRFHEITGVPPSHLRFCLKRPDKALHAQELALSHFVDDRIDVLQHLRGLVPNLYLFGPQKHSVPAWVAPVLTWQSARKQLLRH